MEKHREVPEEYMTVGELAQKMGVTVRTLQYYDNEGLLAPSSQSDGGRRLYTNKDMIKLHQILSMKYVGFSLVEIKSHLISLDTPDDVAAALTEHAAAIQQKMKTLSKSLKTIKALKTEVLQMQSVNFKKYADIIINLQMENEFYWLIKHFDDETLDHFRNRFDKDSGSAMMEKISRLNDTAIHLLDEGVLPESAKGQSFAKSFWDMIMEFTGGDMSLLSKLIETENINKPNDEWNQKQATASAFIEPALGAYFTNLGMNPFEEEKK